MKTHRSLQWLTTLSLVWGCTISSGFSQLYDPPEVHWQRTFWLEESVHGSDLTRNQSGEEWTYSIAPIKDGNDITGYVCAGYATIPTTPGGSNCSSSEFECPDWRKGDRSARIYTMDLAGNKILDQTYGTASSTSWTSFHKVIQTADGGFLAAGFSVLCGANSKYNPYLDPGTGEPAWTNTTCHPNGRHAYVVKTDASLQMEWEYLYGHEPGTVTSTRAYCYEVVERPSTATNAGNFVLLIREWNSVPSGTTSVLLIEITPDGLIVDADGTDPGKNVRMAFSSGDNTNFDHWARSLIVNPADPDEVLVGLAGQGKARVHKLDDDFAEVAYLELTGGAPANHIVHNMAVTAGGDVLAAVMYNYSGSFGENFGGATAEGRVYSFEPASMTSNTFSASSTNYVDDAGTILAGDMWFNVVSTSDGGFATVHTNRLSQWANNTPPYRSEDCAGGCSQFGKTFWNTNPVFTKWDEDGYFQWQTMVENFDPLETVFDECSSGPNQGEPIARCANEQGDIKSAECVYGLVETHDGGLLTVGNNTHNFDDDYLVKLYPDCNVKVDFTTGDDIDAGWTSTSNNHVWDTDRKVRGIVRILDGDKLTIEDGAVIQFDDTRSSGVTTRVIVEPGGQLVIKESSVLKGLEECGTMWDGIQVWAQPGSPNPKRGEVVINDDAMICDAHIGIATAEMEWIQVTDREEKYGTYYEYARVDGSTKDGGKISAKTTTAIFQDNRVGVQIYGGPTSPGKNPENNQSKFKNTIFRTNGPLDGNDYIRGDGSKLSIDAFVKIDGANFGPTEANNATFDDCDFLQNDPTNYSNEDKERGIGFETYSSRYYVKNSTFENLTNAMEVYGLNSFGVKVTGSTFDMNHRGILLSGTREDEIIDNTFDLDAGPAGTAAGEPFAIYMANTDLSAVKENTVTKVGGSGVSYGVVADNNGSANTVSEISKNEFNYTYAGIQPQGVNHLKIACNDYVDNEMALSVNPQSSSGSLNDQGEGCNVNDYRPTEDFIITCGTDPVHINSTIDFLYYEDPDRTKPAKENCVFMPSGWQPCQSVPGAPNESCPLGGGGQRSQEYADDLLDSLGGEQDAASRGEILRELLYVLLEIDTSGEQIIEALTEANLPEADRMLAATYYSWGMPDSSLAVLGRMTLSSASDTLFFSTYYLLDTALQNGMTIHDFGNAEQGQIEEWIDLNYATSFIAKNIAQMSGLTQDKISIEQWPMGKRGRETESNVTIGSTIIAYPVPFTDLVVISFDKPVPDRTRIRVTDIAGKEILNVPVPSKTSEYVLSTANWPVGFYIGQAVSNDSLIGTVRLVRQ